MIKIYELDNSEEALIDKIARLHTKAFPTFFLTQLGLPFLKTLYMGFLEDSDSGIIIANYNDDLAGFLAYSNDYPRFFKGLIKHHILRFTICSLGAAIRHPSYISRLLGAFNKSDSVVKPEKYVELASICVDPEWENRGIGSQLIDYLKNSVDFSSYAYINLETDADGNESVNTFYLKNGFELSGQYLTKEGRRMNEYHFCKDSSK